MTTRGQTSTMQRNARLTQTVPTRTTSTRCPSTRLITLVVLTAITPVIAQTNQITCERRFAGPLVITADVGSPATGVFAADIDGDGDIDALSSARHFAPLSPAGDKISWYENTDGQGRFGAQQVISTTVDFATAVFAADLDGDGDIDALSASSHDDKIAWYENTDGLGTFGPQRIITTAAVFATSVYATDLDGDGDVDVLSVSQRRIAWYENTDGLGTFGPQRTITRLADGARSVFAADLDGDGDIDVLSASQVDNRIAWYENTDGLGTFGPQRNIATAFIGAFSVFASDLDGDGDIDVLAASWDEDKIAWYENTDGLGTFGSQRTITTDADAADSVFAADFDGDGDIDVVSASLFDDKVAWYENTDGLGTFGPQRIITVYADGPFSVFAADVDGDGDTDILSASGFDNTIAWYENEMDCNGNGVNDGCDLADATSLDCNLNGRPDECDFAATTSGDCNANGIPDECDISTGTSLDCNRNAVPDECDISQGPSTDCNSNAIPDECERNEDCNANGVQDICDIAGGTSGDCNFDLVPDDCQPDEDCNANGIRDICDIGAGASDCNGNFSPDSCDIAVGILPDMDGNGVPDQCCVSYGPYFNTPSKSRYLSLRIDGLAGIRSAIRVTFGPNAVFPAIEGQSLWVGAPQEFSEDDVNDPSLTFLSAGLSCEPDFHQWGVIRTLHIFGAEIVPESSYTVQLVNEGCSAAFDVNFSQPATAETGLFGDIEKRFVPNSPPQPDFEDIVAAVSKFLGAAQALPKVDVQLQPSVVRPAQGIGFKDIAAVAGAFLGLSYVDIVPNAQTCTCPSVVTCGATACTSDAQCGSGICLEGFCTDACGRCSP